MVGDRGEPCGRFTGSECDGGPPTGVTVEMTCETERGPWVVEAGPAAEPASRTVEPGETITVGSSCQVDVRIFDRAVSGRHCVLELREGRMLVRDLVSKAPCSRRARVAPSGKRC
jgi:hypothetical protein